VWIILSRPKFFLLPRRTELAAPALSPERMLDHACLFSAQTSPNGGEKPLPSGMGRKAALALFSNLCYNLPCKKTVRFGSGTCMFFENGIYAVVPQCPLARKICKAHNWLYSTGITVLGTVACGHDPFAKGFVNSPTM